MSLSLQIKSLYESGESIESISAAMNLSKEAVEYELLRLREVDESDIPEEDFKVIRSRLIDIAKESADDGLAAKVGMFLWEQKRGTARSKTQAPNVNISQLNALILSSHERIIKELSEGGNRGTAGNLAAPPPAAEKPAEQESNTSAAGGGSS